MPWVTRPLFLLIDAEVSKLEAQKVRIASVPAEAKARSGNWPAVARASVPRPKAMDRLRQYERTLDREFERATVELESLQRRSREQDGETTGPGPERPKS